VPLLHEQGTLPGSFRHEHTVPLLKNGDATPEEWLGESTNPCGLVGRGAKSSWGDGEVSADGGSAERLLVEQVRAARFVALVEELLECRLLVLPLPCGLLLARCRPLAPLPPRWRPLECALPGMLVNAGDGCASDMGGSGGSTCCVGEMRLSDPVAEGGVAGCGELDEAEDAEVDEVDRAGAEVEANGGEERCAGVVAAGVVAPRLDVRTCGVGRVDGGAVERRFEEPAGLASNSLLRLVIAERINDDERTQVDTERGSRGVNLIRWDDAGVRYRRDRVSHGL
jgi:hypothetical protein